MALGVKPGDEVIVPTLTFGATAFAVTYTGAKPVFLDVEEQSWGLDPDLLDSVLAERSRRIAAIIPVDLFGRPADYDQILPSRRGATTFRSSSTQLSPWAQLTMTALPAPWATQASTPSTATRS